MRATVLLLCSEELRKVQTRAGLKCVTRYRTRHSETQRKLTVRELGSLLSVSFVLWSQEAGLFLTSLSWLPFPPEKCQPLFYASPLLCAKLSFSMCYIGWPLFFQCLRLTVDGNYMLTPRGLSRNLEPLKTNMLKFYFKRNHFEGMKL